VPPEVELRSATCPNGDLSTFMNLDIDVLNTRTHACLICTCSQDCLPVWKCLVFPWEKHNQIYDGGGGRPFKAEENLFSLCPLVKSKK
jgi:hypothetical protein